MIKANAPSIRFIGATALSVFLALAMTGSTPAQEATLPGNATSLREAHGDWTVTCAIGTTQSGEALKRCSFSQQQIVGQTQQRALAIELRPDGDGVNGALVLPFGLALGAGVTYQLDEGSVGASQPFRTCLPAGCLVDIAFDARTVASLKSGNVMKVNAIADSGQEMAFSVSLTGFSSAYDRVVALMEQ